MTDYGQMSDAEINRLIAERFGYTCEEEPTYWPNTEMVWRDQRGMKIDDPKFAYDLNSAIVLLKEIGVASLNYSHTDKKWRVTARFAIGDHKYKFEALNPARTICEAWLVRKDSQK